jgi:predicted dinucleotide-binding enzyme
MATAIGAAFGRIGHEVVHGSARRDHRELRVMPHHEAVAFGEFLVLATRWEDTRRVLERSGSFDGKVLMSCVNPETAIDRLEVGHITSAAEEIARWAPTARVVEAFNATYAEWLDLAPANRSDQTVMFCGDDENAREQVRSFISALGFDPLDAGPLRNARYLEPHAALMVYLVREAGYGPKGLYPRWVRGS